MGTPARKADLPEDAMNLRRRPRRIPQAGAEGNRQPSGDNARIGPLRVVVLVPGSADMSRWLTVFSEYAAVRGYTIATVTTEALAAMTEIVAGRADRILIRNDHELCPLVETLTSQSVEMPASQRRPRRLR